MSGQAYRSTSVASPSQHYSVASPMQTGTSFNMNVGMSQSYRGTSTVQSERIISSNVVGEQHLSAVPEDSVQYIEVPVYEEKIVTIPKKEYVEIEKRVPRYKYEWVERVVEVPQVHTVDKQVEVPQVQEIIRHVPKREIVEVPREVVRIVPKIETKIVEREVEVPGEIIEVPKPYLVENKIIVPRYTDKEVPTVVSQKLVPIITESEHDYVDVDLKEYNPILVPVDVYVPKPVARELIASSKMEEHHVIDAPIAQFNSLVKQVNKHISDKDIESLLVKEPSGGIPMLPFVPGTLAIPPLSNEWQSKHVQGSLHWSHNAPAGTIPGGTSGGLIYGAGTIASASMTRTPQYSTTTASNSGHHGTGASLSATTATVNTRVSGSGLFPPSPSANAVRAPLGSLSNMPSSGSYIRNMQMISSPQHYQMMPSGSQTQQQQYSYSSGTMGPTLTQKSSQQQSHYFTTSQGYSSSTAGTSPQQMGRKHASPNLASAPAFVQVGGK